MCKLKIVGDCVVNNKAYYHPDCMKVSRHFPNGDFPSDNVQNCAISQEAFFQKLGLTCWGAVGCNWGPNADARMG